MIYFIERKKSFDWLNKMLGLNGFRFFSIYPFLFITRKEMSSFCSLYQIDDLNESTRFVSSEFPSDHRIFEYSNKFKLYNPDVIKTLLILEELGYSFSVERIHELDGIYLNVDIIKHNEVIFKIEEIEKGFDISLFNPIIKGEIIMSKEKEFYIIKEITKECEQYDISLERYDYYIEEVDDNQYHVNLEHSITGKTIMIKNITFNKYNKITSIGCFNGFVL